MTGICTHDILIDEINEIYFISTDLRAELIGSVEDKIEEFSTDSWNNQLGILEVFTHEWALDGTVKATIEELCKYAVDNDYQAEFYEDTVNITR